MNNDEQCQMSKKAEIYVLDKDLTLYDPLKSPAVLHCVNLSLIRQDKDEVAECQLTFQVSPDLYQRINTQALFNLTPEIRIPLSDAALQPEDDVQIEVNLDPRFLPQLAEHITNANQVADYLQQLSQKQFDHPLLLTENWYALYVKQQQETGEAGYQTFWSYLQPFAFRRGNFSKEKITEAMSNFIKEWGQASTSEAIQEFLEQAAEQMSTAWKELTDELSGLTHDSVASAIEEIADAFEDVADHIADEPEESASKGQIFEAILDFFEVNEWPFVQIPEETTLRFAYRGESGQWDCYAVTRDAEHQFLFYSICPIAIPAERRLNMAEFLTRANRGLTIGNFEMDFDFGEISYKTSIDVTGDHLSTALIEGLVYANVTVMDVFLPSILAVIEGEVSPVEAIAHIENQSKIPVDSSHDKPVS